MPSFPSRWRSDAGRSLNTCLLSGQGVPSGDILSSGRARESGSSVHFTLARVPRGGLSTAPAPWGAKTSRPVVARWRQASTGTSNHRSTPAPPSNKRPPGATPRMASSALIVKVAKTAAGARACPTARACPRALLRRVPQWRTVGRCSGGTASDHAGLLARRPCACTTRVRKGRRGIQGHDTTATPVQPEDGQRDPGVLAKRTARVRSTGGRSKIR